MKCPAGPDAYLLFRNLKGLQVVADDAQLLLKLHNFAAKRNANQFCGKVLNSFKIVFD